jgi:hypothetical protein
MRPAQDQSEAFALDLTNATSGPVREARRHPPQHGRIDRCAVKSNDTGKSRHGTESLAAWAGETTAFAAPGRQQACRLQQGRSRA